MSTFQVQKIMEKIQKSCSQDVQRGAIRNLMSKLQCGILAYEEILLSAPHSPVLLLEWTLAQLEQKNYEQILQVSEVLHQLSRIAAAKQQLKEKVFEICKLRDHLIAASRSPHSLEAMLAVICDGQHVVPMKISNAPTLAPIQPAAASILTKPDERKQEFQHFPTIVLTEIDEKILFDILVQLKFGNSQTITHTLKDQLAKAFKDMPVEVFRQKHEILEELVILSNSQKDDTILYYAIKAQERFVASLRKRIQQLSGCLNFNKDPQAYLKDTRDFIVRSYPSLDPQPKPSDQQQDFTQKTFKQIVDVIVNGVSCNFLQFSGQRITLLKNIIKLLKVTSQSNRAATIDSIQHIINQLTIIFDQNDENNLNYQLIPLYVVGFECLELLSDDKVTISSRFINYMAQAQFSFIFTPEQSRKLTQLLSVADPEVSKQQVAVIQIRDSLNLLYENQQLTRELLILSPDEFADSVNFHYQVLIGLPLSDNLAIIKNYLTHYLIYESAIFDAETMKEKVLKSFECILSSPNRTITQIFLTQMIQNLSATQNIKCSKNQVLSICKLQLEMLCDPYVIEQLFASCISQPEVQKLVIDLYIEVLQKRPTLNLSKWFSTILSVEHKIKRAKVLVNLLATEYTEIQILNFQMNLFSKRAEVRLEASKMLFNFRQVDQRIQKQDHLDELLDLQKQNVAFKDEIDHLLEEDFTFREISLSVEELSHLEQLALNDSLDLQIRCGAFEQLSRIMIFYNNNQSTILKSLQVRPELMHSYFESLLGNIHKCCCKHYELLTNEKSVSKVTKYATLISKMLDLFTVSLNNFENDLTEMAIYVIGVYESKPVRYSAFRYIYTKIFKGPHIDRTGYIELLKLPASAKPEKDVKDGETPAAFWKRCYPLKQNVITYIHSYQQFLSQGVTYQQYQQKQLTLSDSENFIKCLDSYIAYLTLQIDCKIDDSVFTDLQKLMLSPAFFESKKTYVLHMIRNLSETRSYWLGLLNQVNQYFLESDNQEKMDYLYLYIQLLSVVKQKSDVHKYLLQYLPRAPFNPKVVSYILKLLKYHLIEADQNLINYIQLNIFQHTHHDSFENSSNLIKLLRLSRKLNFFEKQDPLDQQIAFSRLLQFTQSHIQTIRFLSYNTLSNFLTFFDDDQMLRIIDLTLDGLYQMNESESVYSMIICIVSKLMPVEKMSRIITFAEPRLKGSVSTFCKAGLLKLIYSFCLAKKEEGIQQLYNYQLDQYCIKALTSLDDEHSIFLALHAAQLINLLLRQSVSKSFGLFQGYNLIESLLGSFHKLKKFISEQKICVALPNLLLELSQMMQYGTHYHKDYVAIECKRISTIHSKWFELETLSKVVQNDYFTLFEKIGIAKTLACFHLINFELQDNTEMIYGLIGVYRSILHELASNDSEEVRFMIIDATQILSSLASTSNQSKRILIHSGVLSKVASILNKELDAFIYDQQKSVTKSTVSNKQQVMNKSQSFVDIDSINQSQLVRTMAIFIKLFFKKVQQTSQIGASDKEQGAANGQISDVMNAILQILDKLLHLSFKHTNAYTLEIVQNVVQNIASNEDYIQPFCQVLSEQKWQFLQTLQKLIKMDVQQFQFQALISMLGVLGQHSDVRIVFVRQKLLEDLQEKLIKSWENKKKWAPFNSLNSQIIFLHASLSFYKDIQQKLLGSQQFNQILIEILGTGQIQEQAYQDIILMLSNCSLNSQLKKSILALQKIPPISISIVTDQNCQPLNRFKVSQLILNLLYKCTAAVTIYNKRDVFEGLEFSMKDTQRMADRLSLSQKSHKLVSQAEEDKENIGHLRQLSNNLNQIMKILQIEW